MPVVKDDVVVGDVVVMGDVVMVGVVVMGDVVVIGDVVVMDAVVVMGDVVVMENASFAVVTGGVLVGSTSASSKLDNSGESCLLEVKANSR